MNNNLLALLILSGGIAVVLIEMISDIIALIYFRIMFKVNPQLFEKVIEDVLVSMGYYQGIRKEKLKITLMNEIVLKRLNSIGKIKVRAEELEEDLFSFK